MLFVATLLGILLVALALAGVVIAFLWRQTENAVALIHGLRADVDRLAGEHVRFDTERQQFATAVQQAIGGAHNTAATALDRILYYTQHSAILERLGAKYDKAIAKLRAKAEEANAAAASAPDETPADAPPSAIPAQPEKVDVIETSAPETDETTDDDMEKIVGSIGAVAGMPCG